MFKFNFGSDSEKSREEERKSVIEWYASKRVKVPGDIAERLKGIGDKDVIKLHYEGNITLTSLSPRQVIDGLRREENEELSDALEADKNHSDLVPGKYEGGMKIWECTTDLVNYLSRDTCDSFAGKKVLDLGCGSGILGIFALLKGASVTFQDYNAEVLDLITIPNVYLNKQDVDDGAVEFYSGDWDSFTDVISQTGGEEAKNSKKTKSQVFDYILTCETIYNPDNYSKVHRAMKELLKREGTCYLAAKTCYFGVGGNVQGFVDYVTRENAFHVESCWRSNDGVTREILKITFSKGTT